MIGHYLMTLTMEQEDRVLTETFQPIAHLGASDCSRCLVLTAMGLENGAPATGLTSWENLDFYGKRGDPKKYAPGWRYEYACGRFGTERVNAAIRARILRNRLWRTLSGSAVVQQEAQTT